MIPPLLGLVLAGGRSTRMGCDKAQLVYRDRPQALHCCDQLAAFCEQVFLSVRPGQLLEHEPYELLPDREQGLGPLGGLLTALAHEPRAAWLVVACDLPLLDAATLEYLVAHREPAQPATAYRSTHDGLPEPLCAIYEPAMDTHLQELFAEGVRCPRKALLRTGYHALTLLRANALDNANDPDEAARLRQRLSQ